MSIMREFLVIQKPKKRYADAYKTIAVCLFSHSNAEAIQQAFGTNAFHNIREYYAPVCVPVEAGKVVRV